LDFIQPAIYLTSTICCFFFSIALVLAQKFLKLHTLFHYLGFYLVSISFVIAMYALIYLPFFQGITRELLLLRRLFGLIAGYQLIRMILSIKEDLLSKPIVVTLYGLFILLFSIALIDMIGNFQWLFNDVSSLIYVGVLYKIVYIPFSLFGLSGSCFLLFLASNSQSPENKRLIRILLIGLVLMLPFQYFDLISLLVKKDPFTNAFFLFNPAIMVLFVFIFIFIIEFVRIQSRYATRKRKSKIPQIDERVTEAFPKLYERIIYLMRNQLLYKNPTLTIEDIARDIGENKNTVSLLINRYAGVNFKTLVNQYRVDHMKRFLNDPDCSLSILEISQRCGFNSKTSLNRVFEQFEKMSPREYREKASQ
jgi:AraC-like DNA-binding protein